MCTGIYHTAWGQGAYVFYILKQLLYSNVYVSKNRKTVSMNLVLSTTIGGLPTRQKSGASECTPWSWLVGTHACIMLRSILARRRFCTSAPTSATAAFHERVKTEYAKLMVSAWRACRTHDLLFIPVAMPWRKLWLTCNSILKSLQDADWVDTDGETPIELFIESCDGLIDEYRKYYDPAVPQDDLYNDVAALHYAKEVASVSDSYSELAERTLRRHEGMVGFLGSKFLTFYCAPIVNMLLLFCDWRDRSM